MTGDDANAALLARVAALEKELGIVQVVLGRCVVTSVAVSMTALAIGREMEAVIGAAGLTPTIAPLLRQLEEQVSALRSAVEDNSHAG